MPRIILSAVLAIVLLIGAACAYLGTFGVFIPETAIKRQVKAGLPLTLVKLGGVLEIREIAINTRRDGTVFVSGDGGVEAMGAETDVRFSLIGRVAYADGGVYLRDVSVESLRVLPAEGAPPIAGAELGRETAVFALLRTRLTEAADRAFAETSVYDLRRGSWKARTFAPAIRSVGVDAHGAQVAFSVPALFWVAMKVFGLPLLMVAVALAAFVRFVAKRPE